MGMNRETIVTQDLAGRALELVSARLLAAVERSGSATLVLSGGSTPLELYRQLAASSLPWDRIHLFWGDERFVPHDHEDSNYGAAREAFLDGLAIPAGNVHQWPILDTAAASAEAYSDVLQNVLGAEPIFDVTLLGIGTDGHTASLFPGTGAALADGLTVASSPPGVAQQRLSLTLPLLSASRCVMFLVSGQDKRGVLAGLVEGGAEDPDLEPARAVTAADELLVVTDQEL